MVAVLRVVRVMVIVMGTLGHGSWSCQAFALGSHLIILRSERERDCGPVSKVLK